MTATLRIEDGVVTFIYHDALTNRLDLGAVDMRRVSHVEPCGRDWTADMSPVGGPVLGPFTLRQDALDAEMAWLRDNRGL